MRISRQQRCGFAFTAVCCLIFGGAIIVCGVLFGHLDPYDDENVNLESSYQYYYTQYWLGIPLFVLGILLFCLLCCRVKPMAVLCIILSTLTLLLSITAVVLEGPKWRTWIAIRRFVLDNDEQENNGMCLVVPRSLTSFIGGLSCRELYYATLMQSVIVVSSIIAIVLSQFAIFVSVRVLDWMSVASYDVTHKNHYTNAGNNAGGSSVVIMSDM